jgi:hypothetical protein
MAACQPVTATAPLLTSRCSAIPVPAVIRARVASEGGQARRPGHLHRHLGAPGSAWPGGLALPPPYAGKLASLRDLAARLSDEITMPGTVIADLLACHAACGTPFTAWLARPRTATKSLRASNGIARVHSRSALTATRNKRAAN